MNKNLIVYFSRNQENYVNGNIVNLETGNTKFIALKIRDYINSDIFELVPLHPYPNDYYDCTKRAKQELSQNERPKIKNIIPHIEQYQTIYLCYPNWWGTVPMIIMSFLEEYDLKDKVIIPICTHEGSGFGTSIQDIQKICHQGQIEKGFEIRGSQVLTSQEYIENWIKRRNLICQ